MTEGLFCYTCLLLTIPPSCSASHLPLHKGGFGKPSLKKHHQRNFLGGVSYFYAKVAEMNIRFLFCTRLYELTFGFFRIALRLEVVNKEDQRYTDNNHQYGPELRGGNSRNELASVVTAKELVTESEDSIGDNVHAHIIFEVELQKKEEHHAEDDEEEDRLVKLSRMNRLGKSRELDAQEGIGRLAVAAACEEATESTKCVRDSNTTRCDRKQVNSSAVKLISCDPVYQKEGSNTADEAADEGHALTDMEARLGILDVIIDRLEERGREKSDGYSADTGKEGEIKEALADSLLLAD